MRKVAGRLRLDLAQFRELEAFSAFGSDLDAASKQQLARGARLVELLKQPQYSPFPVEEEVVSVWAGTNGKLDEVPVEDVRRFERDFLDYLRHDKRGILGIIAETRDLGDDTVQALEDAVKEFGQQFQAGPEHRVVDTTHAAPADEKSIEQEKIKRRVPPKSHPESDSDADE